MQQGSIIILAQCESLEHLEPSQSAANEDVCLIHLTLVNERISCTWPHSSVPRNHCNSDQTAPAPLPQRLLARLGSSLIKINDCWFSKARVRSLFYWQPLLFQFTILSWFARFRTEGVRNSDLLAVLSEKISEKYIYYHIIIQNILRASNICELCDSSSIHLQLHQDSMI